MHVPYQSQHAEDVPLEWRSRACGIVSLRMALCAYGAPVPDIATFIKEAEYVQAFSKEGYWVHQRLTWLAHNYGIPAYSEEFRSDTVDMTQGTHAESPYALSLRDYGLQKITHTLMHGGLVMVSVPRLFEQGGHYHLVLLVGADRNTFIYHDPDVTPGAALHISRETFLRYWRRYALFLGSVKE